MSTWMHVEIAHSVQNYRVGKLCHDRMKILKFGVDVR